MDIKAYKRMLADAQKDLQKTLEEREEIDKRIAGLKQTIIALSRVCLPFEERDFWHLDLTMSQALGITDQCREVLKTSEKPLTPIEIRDQLVRMGLDAQKYQNLMASVHKILKRLFKAAEIGQLTGEDGEVYYYKIKRRRFVRKDRKEKMETERQITEKEKN